MSDYRKVKGWSAMMREVVLARQMPPWQADPHFGEFDDSLALTPEESQTLIRWIEASAPRGEGADPLDGYGAPLPGWALGEPDKVIEIPEQAVEAEGVFDYRYVFVDSPFDHDVWLRAVQVNPGHTRVLHHVIATAHASREDQEGRSIAGYAPGMGAYAFPEGTGILLPKGAKLHYAASGKAETDRTRRVLLSVPNYNFNGQRDYHCREPVPLPKGTRLVVRAA